MLAQKHSQFFIWFRFHLPRWLTALCRHRQMSVTERIPFM
jgi:hypothetical protein